MTIALEHTFCPFAAYTRDDLFQKRNFGKVMRCQLLILKELYKY